MAKRLRAYRHLAAWLATGLLTMAVQPAQAGLRTLEKLFVFGDSLTDTGNSWALTNNAFPPEPYYYQGRASNGPVSPEYLWQLFNPGSTGGPTPSRSGGTNYAINGATTGLVNYNYLRGSSYSIFKDEGAAPQLSDFINDSPSFNPNTSLFLVWIFPNDVLSWLTTGKDAGTVLGGAPNTVDAQAMITTGISNIATMITQLAARGATEFLVPNMPDLGQTPVFRGDPFSAALLSALTAAFNTNLDPVLQSLQANLPGVEISRFQTDDLFDKVITNPSSYGFTNVTAPCMIPAPYTVCLNPDQYLFWDDFHPTTAAQRLIAQNFYAATVETPGPLPVAGVTAAFAWSRRLRHRIKNSKASRPAPSTDAG